MEGVKQRLLGLGLPPLLFCLLDFAMTLFGQSAQYWAGDYGLVSEGSPTFHDLLQIHPAAFAAGGLVWILVFVVGIVLLPDTLALIVSIVVTFGHTAGAATWLSFRFHYGYQACIALFLVSAIFLGVGIRWGWRAVPERLYRLQGWPPLVRWGLAGLLVGVGVYLYLWPRNPCGDAGSTKDDISTKIIAAIATTDRELEQLGQGRQITRLCLAGTEITSAGLAHLERLTQLQGLTLRGLQVTDADLKHLEGLSELKWLNLESVDMPEAGLRHLKGLTRLQGLTLHGPEVTDAWLEHLKGPPHLQSLQIESTKVTDAGLEHLKGLSQLRMLNLVGTLVSGAGLEHLKGLSQLQHLYLGETKITDAGLEHLKGLSQLQLLYLGGTNCTPEGRKKLQQALPKCNIAG